MGKVLIWFVIIISTVVLYCLMEEKREPLSEMAIERKIQILRNKHMDSEVIALVKSDYEYGLTDDEIGLYLNKSYDIEQMKVLSKCLHKGVSEELLTLLKDSRMAAPKMQTALWQKARRSLRVYVRLWRLSESVTAARLIHTT